MKMRRVPQMTAFSALIALTAVMFQNCGTPVSTTDNLFGKGDYASCIGFSCGTDADSVLIWVANPNPIQLTKGTATSSCDNTNCFDVSGYCDKANYPNSAIYIAFDSGALQRTSAYCDEIGRFRVQVQTPAGYDQNALHSLKVVLRVIDASGTMYDNPTGQNVNTVAVTSVAP